MAESVAEATERSISAARHLTDLDAGAVAALRELARRMDGPDLDGLDDDDAADVAAAMAKDNVTIPTYLKYCDALRLTPASRGVVVGESEAKGKLANLRALRTEKSA